MSSHSKNGFTLLELLVAIAIIGILCGFVYSRYIEFRNRASDIVVLHEMNSIIEALEVYQQTNGSFPKNVNEPAACAFNDPYPLGICLEGIYSAIAPIHRRLGFMMYFDFIGTPGQICISIGKDQFPKSEKYKTIFKNSGTWIPLQTTMHLWYNDNGIRKDCLAAANASACPGI